MIRGKNGPSADPTSLLFFASRGLQNLVDLVIGLVLLVNVDAELIFGGEQG